MEELKKIFREFIDESLSAESKKRYGPAVSNYYKALSILCSYLIYNKTRKQPKNHTEIFLFLQVSFPEIYKITNEVFPTYKDSYEKIMKQEDCEKIKNAIKQISKISGTEKEFEEDIKKI